MKRILVTVCVVLMTVMSSLGQIDINKYKYAILPQKFSFFKQADQFKLNTLTRHLFKQNGFDVYYNIEKMLKDLSFIDKKAISG
ncbi:MAG: hypothetical protein HRT67_07870 [Flavobacteriaceae bacterium]|nr:hypothetical protein [Flavobacteriaceae bacterium]